MALLDDPQLFLFRPSTPATSVDNLETSDVATIGKDIHTNNRLGPRQGVFHRMCTVDRGFSLVEALRAPRVDVSESGVRAHVEVGPEAIATFRSRCPEVSGAGGNHLGAQSERSDMMRMAFPMVLPMMPRDGTCVVVPHH
ncbi:hypothetical protein [Mesorhizobium shangrilense]|uniref:Uncharacterized protein n=1 Tax=Mesorhizobium shangrilense TaxID=460060 RepID=A0ABV2DT98_9HYPH